MCSPKVPSTPAATPQYNTVGATTTASAETEKNPAANAPTKKSKAALASQNIMTSAAGLGAATTNKKTMLGV